MCGASTYSKIVEATARGIRWARGDEGGEEWDSGKYEIIMECRFIAEQFNRFNRYAVALPIVCFAVTCIAMLLWQCDHHHGAARWKLLINHSQSPPTSQPLDCLYRNRFEIIRPTGMAATNNSLKACQISILGCFFFSAPVL